MGAPVTGMPFSMPMFRRFVPEKVRPWVYVLMAFNFQFSGGLYLGSLNQMMGETSLMREDLLMCLYANLAGMAVYFPVLFRMKFRFTNKTLLTAAAAGIMACNLAAPHITHLPLLWAVCFISGVCKIQGTFECMSNIQLWMTPKRDFTVFFPLLHVVILCSMQLSDLLACHLTYYFHWGHMQLLMAGVMMADLLIITVCTRHFRTIKKFPLYGIDWMGAVLWAALLLEAAYFFCYGDWYDWLVSPVMQMLLGAMVLTLGLCIWRMLTVRHPYFEPAMWRYRHLIPILLLITVVEGLLATEHVAEEVFCEEIMHYGILAGSSLNWWALAGIVGGCMFALWWMHVRRLSYLRLLVVGVMALAAYQVGMYFSISADINIGRMGLPIACRGFAYAVLSATFMVCLEEIMSFRHFFQALSLFNMLHMVVGGVMGAAVYTEGLSHYVADNIALYAGALDSIVLNREGIALEGITEAFITDVMEMGIKQVYGLAAYACIFLGLLFLLYDAPIRRQLKLMPGWRQFRKEVAASLTFKKGKHG